MQSAPRRSGPYSVRPPRRGANGNLPPLLSSSAAGQPGVQCGRLPSAHVDGSAGGPQMSERLDRALVQDGS